VLLKLLYLIVGDKDSQPLSLYALLVYSIVVIGYIFIGDQLNDYIIEAKTSTS